MVIQSATFVFFDMTKYKYKKSYVLQNQSVLSFVFVVLPKLSAVSQEPLCASKFWTGSRIIGISCLHVLDTDCGSTCFATTKLSWGTPDDDLAE